MTYARSGGDGTAASPLLVVAPAPCRLVGGAFAVVVQALLCLVAFIALFFKWVREMTHGHDMEKQHWWQMTLQGDVTDAANAVRTGATTFAEESRVSTMKGGRRLHRRAVRSFREWSFDVSKQAFSAVVSHAFNIVLAVVLAHTKIHYHDGPAVHPDQCAWYLINYIADCIFGVLLIYFLLRLVEHTAHRLGSQALAESGNYYEHIGGAGSSSGNQKWQEPSVRIWLLQCTAFVLITLVSKCMLALVLIPLAKPLGQFGLFLAQPLKAHPELELVVVMVVFPAFLNVFSFWMIDSFLQKRRSDETVDNGEGGEDQDLLGNGDHMCGGDSRFRRRQAGDEFPGRVGSGSFFGTSDSSNNVKSIFQDSLCFAGESVPRTETPSPVRSVASATWDASPISGNDGLVSKSQPVHCSSQQGLLVDDVETLQRGTIESINSNIGGRHGGGKSTLAYRMVIDSL